MVDYSTWAIRNDIPVTEVKLDKFNPRMPENSESLTQEDVLNLMVNDYKIIELAESIATKGFMPLDNMIVTYENDIPVVLEGNRRITALKLLINPAIAPIKERQKYELLSSQIDAKMIMNPNFAVAPSREAASPLILDRHTIATEIPWSPIMQAEFHREVLRKRGLDFPNKEVLEEFNLEEKEMADSLLRLHLYGRICSFYYPNDSIERKVKDKLKFEITTLERLVDSTISQKRFKYKVSDSKLAISDEGLFNAFLKSIVIHMYEPIENLPRITSRSANKSEQIDKYLKAVGREIAIGISMEGGNQNAQIPPSNEGAAKDRDSYILENGVGKEVEKSCSTSTIFVSQKHQVKRRTVHSNEMRFGYSSPANQRIYDELGKIPVKEAPFCVTIATRVLLERTIRAYLKKMGRRKMPRVENGKIKKVDIIGVDFGEILDWIVDEKAMVVLDPEIRKILGKFKYGSNTELLSLSRLNAVIHEPLQVVDKDGVLSIWDNLVPILEYFMNNPETNAKSMSMQD